MLTLSPRLAPARMASLPNLSEAPIRLCAPSLLDLPEQSYVANYPDGVRDGKPITRNGMSE
jgi:hypothetical protein